MNLMNSYIPLLIIASQRSSVGRILESDISVKRAVGYEYPTYFFQTTHHPQTIHTNQYSNHD